jgi:hypothetical protein
MHQFVLFLCLLSAVANAQQYYEASGQTSVFTLTAGAKAGPGTSAVRLNSHLTPSAPPHMLVTMQNVIHIIILGVQGHGRVSIYNLVGKTIQTAYIDGKSSITLKSVPRGVYFARLEVNDRLVQTTRFWKER